MNEHHHPQDEEKAYPPKGVYNSLPASAPYAEHPSGPPPGSYGQASPSQQAHGQYPPQQSCQKPPPAQIYGRSSSQPHDASYPSQPLSQDLPPGGMRTLHIRYTGITSRTTQILDSDKDTPLYTAEMHYFSKPHIVLRSVSHPDTVIGTVTFHTFSSSKIDLVLHGHPIALEAPSIFTWGWRYCSPAANGATRSWKSKGVVSGGNMVCLDDRETLVARFDASYFSLMEEGRLGLARDEIAQSGMAIDEVVLSGLAMVELRRRVKSNLAGAVVGAVGGFCLGYFL